MGKASSTDSLDTVLYNGRIGQVGRFFLSHLGILAFQTQALSSAQSWFFLAPA